MSVTVLVGDPRPQSPTLRAAQRVAVELTDRPPDHIIDLATFGTCLIEGGPVLDQALDTVWASRQLVVASPAYQGSFTGVLKLFLDRFGTGSLAGLTAVPVMLGSHWRYALAPEIALKPVLAELGARCPTRGLFLIDSESDTPGVLNDWLPEARADLDTTPEPSQEHPTGILRRQPTDAQRTA